MQDALLAGSLSEEQLLELQNNREILAKSITYNDLTLMKKSAIEIMRILPHDYLANFYVAYSSYAEGNRELLKDFLKTNEIFEAADAALYEVVEFLISHPILSAHDLMFNLLENLPSNDIDAYKSRLEIAYQEAKNKEENYDVYPRDIFICHSSLNETIANEIVKYIEQGGYSVWISNRNLRPNDNVNYWDNIKFAIENCTLFIYLSSKDTIYSTDVKKEIIIAQKSMKKLLEIKLDDVSSTIFFKKVFEGLKWLPLYELESIKDSNLLERIHGLIDESDSTSSLEQIRQYILKEKYTQAKELIAQIILSDRQNGELWYYQFLIENESQNLETILLSDKTHLEKSFFNAQQYASSPLKERLNQFWQDFNSRFYQIEDKILIYLNNEKIKNIYIPEDVLVIGVNAFKNNEYIETVVLSDSVVSIDESAFEGCTNLKKVTLNQRLERIASKAFKHTLQLHSIHLPAHLEVVESEVFMNSGLNQITIPDNVLFIKERAFYQSAIMKVFLNENITQIDSEAFTDCLQLEEFTVPTACSYFKSIDGVLYDFSEQELLAYPSNKADSHYELLSTTQSVKAHAFQGSKNLVSIKFHKTLSRIGSHAFAYSQKLRRISVDAHGLVVGEKAFSFMKSLEEISIHSDSLQFEGIGHFAANLRLKTVRIDNTALLSEAMFDSCRHLETVAFDARLRHVSKHTFKDCKNLRNIRFNSAPRWESNSFFNCQNLVISVTENINETVDLTCYQCQVVVEK